jgi:integrase
MSNIKYQGNFYNEAFKSIYLAPYPEGTQKNYVRIFKITSKFEIALGKDLYDFSLDEISNILEYMEPATVEAAYSNAQIIRLYINDAILKSEKRDNINPLSKVTTEWIHQFCDKEQQIYLSEEQIIELESFCYNEQDSIIIRLLHGTRYSEILNLRPMDIDSTTNKLTLTDSDGTTRDLLVSARCISMLFETYEQKRYLKKNGNSKSSMKSSLYANLIDTGFIIKLSDTRATGRADEHAVLRRLKNFKLDGKAISSKAIVNSGIVKYAKDILMEKDTLSDEILLPVAERFCILNKYLLRKRANEELIKKVYGDLYTDKEFKLVIDDPDFCETDVKKREGQLLFKRNILEHYESRCAISREECLFVLEAAHIQGYVNSNSNDVRNGLLLRADIHLLFDRGLIIVDSQYNVVVSPQLDSKEYQSFNNKKIHESVKYIV